MATIEQKLADVLRETESGKPITMDRFNEMLGLLKSATERGMAQAFLIVVLDKLNAVHQVKKLEHDGLAALVDHMKAGGGLQ